MNVSLEDAYREACLALGEAVVRERFLSAEVQRLTAEQSDLPAKTCGEAHPDADTYHGPGLQHP